MITFKYLGKTYQVFSDLDKKLKRMGITENDIEIISDKIVEYEDNKDLHEYKNMYNKSVYKFLRLKLDLSYEKRRVKRGKEYECILFQHTKWR